MTRVTVQRRRTGGKSTKLNRLPRFAEVSSHSLTRTGTLRRCQTPPQAGSGGVGT